MTIWPSLPSTNRMLPYNFTLKGLAAVNFSLKSRSHYFKLKCPAFVWTNQR